MDIIELDEDNVSEYEGVLDRDVAENIGREFYAGIVAEEDGDPKGAMIWEYKNLEEDEEDTLAEICFTFSEDGETIEALLEAFDDQSQDNEVTESFFECGMLPEEIREGFADDGFEVSAVESRDVVVNVGDIAHLASKKRKLPRRVVGLEEILELQFMQGVTNLLFNGRRGIVEDLEYIEKEWFAQDISSCVITDGKVTGMFLIHQFPSGRLMPVLFAAIGPDYQKDLMLMVMYSAKKTMENYPADNPIVVRRHSEAVVALVKKMFKGKSGEQAVQGKRAGEGNSGW